MRAPAFCASCTEERVDLAPEWMNGKRVYLCSSCRLGEVRGGRWSFDRGRDANGMLGRATDGNRRTPQRRSH